MTSSGRAASRAARVGAGVVAVGAAALSFRGTADFAEQSHAVDPGWGWVVPLVVEAGVLTAAAIAWVRSGDGVTAGMETIVMASLLTLSVVINVAHAAATTLLGHVVAATPPVALLVAVEGLLREQRRMARRSITPVMAHPGGDDPVTDLRSAAIAAPEEVFTGINSPRAAAIRSVPPLATADAAGPWTKEALTDFGGTSADISPESCTQSPAQPTLLLEVFRALDAGEAVTGASVGSWLNVSESTGLRRLRELRVGYPELNERMHRFAPTRSKAQAPTDREKTSAPYLLMP